MSDNAKKYTIVIAILFAISLTAAGISGCSWEDIVRVKTPVTVQQDQGLPASMTVTESRGAYRLWFERTKTQGSQWKANIDRSSEMVGLLNNLTLGALDAAGPAIMGLPFGGLALPFLTGLGALFVKRPGDATKAVLAKEKESSYNEGLEVGKKLAAG